MPFDNTVAITTQSVQIVDGNGNTVGTWNGSTGILTLTDPVNLFQLILEPGNPMLRAVAPSGSEINLNVNTNSTYIDFIPQKGPGIPGMTVGNITNNSLTAPDYRPQLTITGPTINTSTDFPEIILAGVGVNTATSDIELLADSIIIDADLQNYAGGRAFGNLVSLGRGIQASASATTNSAAVSAETVILTTGTMTFYTGRAYRVEIGGGLFSNTANNWGKFRVWKTSLAGTLLLDFTNQETLQNTGFVSEVSNVGYISNTTGSNITNTTLALTLQSNAGTVAMYGATNTPRYISVTDIGAASAYPMAVPIT